MGKWLTIRAEDSHMEAAETIRKASGLRNRSEVLRLMLESAQVGEGAVTIRLPITNRNGALTLAGEAPSVNRKDFIND